jgi:glycosyltransferase involved in cell wall biosynthesis
VNYPFKVIIADDHSCLDRSKDIIKEYAARHENIEPIYASENCGYLSNILRAKEKAKTKYLCLLDADDYWTDMKFLQRAYDFLNSHEEYSIYEANVEVVTEEGKNGKPFLSPKFKSGTYSEEMYLSNRPVPISQTTGMFFRNRIFFNGIPSIMKNAIGTRSERSFEGDTGRFIMHLRHGLAYYDSSIVGCYRKTSNGIWTRLSETKKLIISARFYQDYYQYYGTRVDFFVNTAFKTLQKYLVVKQKELNSTDWREELIDEYERLMVEDVFRFCKQYEDKIDKRMGIKEKVRQVYRVLRM